MKKYIVAILSFWTLSSLAFAADKHIKHIPEKKVIRIDVSDDDHFDEKEYRRYMRHSKYDYKAHNYANRRLRQKVRQLELAVKQLQDEIFFLRDEHRQNGRRKSYTCVLDTGRKGFYIGKANTQVEAKALAFQSCSQKKGDFWCGGNKVTCEEEKSW